MSLEDGLAGFVAFDGELGGLADSGMQGPVTAASGPDGDDGSVWGIANSGHRRAGVWLSGGCGRRWKWR
jgi:hypothetical protein